MRSICEECKSCVCEETVGRGRGCQPALYSYYCEEGSDNYETEDGCYRFEQREDDRDD